MPSTSSSRQLRRSAPQKSIGSIALPVPARSRVPARGRVAILHRASRFPTRRPARIPVSQPASVAARVQTGAGACAGSDDDRDVRGSPTVRKQSDRADSREPSGFSADRKGSDRSGPGPPRPENRSDTCLTIAADRPADRSPIPNIGDGQVDIPSIASSPPTLPARSHRRAVAEVERMMTQWVGRSRICLRPALEPWETVWRPGGDQREHAGSLVPETVVGGARAD